MENNNQRIIFSKNTADIIFAILEKYKLKESSKELEEKLFGKNLKPLNGGVVLNLTLSYITGKIQKNILIDSLGEDLKIPPTVAENITKDIEKELVSISKKVSVEEWQEGRAKEVIYSDEELYQDDTPNIVFNLPNDTMLDDVIDEMLKDNGLEESDENYLDKYIDDIEPWANIIKSAAITLAEKKLPEEKILELLQKHLEISPQTARKVLQDINQKLVPFAKTKNLEPDDMEKGKLREELLNKIRPNESIEDLKPREIPNPQIKKPAIIDVEDNAENMTEEVKKEANSDPYKEPIE